MNTNTFSHATAQVLTSHLLLCNDKMPRQTTVLSLHAQVEMELAAQLTANVEPLRFRITDALVYGLRLESLAVIAQREQMAKANRPKRTEWLDELDYA